MNDASDRVPDALANRSPVANGDPVAPNSVQGPGASGLLSGGSGATGSPAEGGLASAAPAAEPKRRRRRFLPRFTLRTLTLCVLLVSSGLLLWLHWAPWVPLSRLDADIRAIGYFAFSHDGQRVSTGESGLAQEWDARTGSLIGAQPIHASMVTQFAMTPQGFYQACLGDDELLQEPIPFTAPPGEIAKMKEKLSFSVGFRTKGRTAYEVFLQMIGELNQKEGLGIRAEWEEPFGKTPQPHDKPAMGYGTSPLNVELEEASWQVALESVAPEAFVDFRYEPGRIVLRSRVDWINYDDRLSAVLVWNLQTGALVKKFTGLPSHVQRLQFAGDGKYLIACLDGYAVRIWKTEDWSVHCELPDNSSALYPGPVLSPDGRNLATYKDQTFGVWRLEGAPEFQAVPLGVENLEELWFSPDSDRLLVLTWSHKAILYSLDPPEKIAEWEEAPGPPHLMARDYKNFEFSLDGKRILNFEQGASACVRDAKTGGRLDGAISTGPDRVEHAAFARDGRRMVFRTDFEAGHFVWDVEDLRKLVRLPPFTRHPDREKLRAMLGLEPEPPQVPVSENSGQFPIPFYTNLNRHYEFDVVPARFAPDGERLVGVVPQYGLVVWERRRPEWWWGVAWLPEFWLTVVFALLLVWSLVRDFKTLRKTKALVP